MKVAAIGECMMEFRDAGSGLFALGYGGDTFNTAAYLARLGVSVTYVTALGDDPFSDQIVALAESEGIGVDLIARVPGRVPGLYLIRTDALGERTFFYWRDTAPARELFELSAADGTVEGLQAHDLIYLSGITLSLYAQAGLDVLFAALDRARAAGARVCFDGNYRARGWPDPTHARTTFNAMLRRTDIALPTLDDDRMLFGDADAGASIERYRQAGIDEIVVKNGAEGCFVVEGKQTEPVLIEVDTIVEPVDTTAAGDSFNAGYLAARAGGASLADAVRAGHRLAAVVIRHRGAIIAREFMPDLDELLPADPRYRESGQGASGQGASGQGASGQGASGLKAEQTR